MDHNLTLYSKILYHSFYRDFFNVDSTFLTRSLGQAKLLNLDFKETRTKLLDEAPDSNHQLARNG